MTRACVMNAQRQTYKNFVHSVNITVDDLQYTRQVEFTTDVLLSDLQNPRLILDVRLNEQDTITNHFNNLSAIKAVPGWEQFDIYLKMDDDDIYLEKYVEEVVAFFTKNPNVDITSSAILIMLNGKNARICNNQNLGGNPTDTDYKMPMTFAFTKKALDVILPLTKESICGFDDMMWRVAWEKAGLVHKAMDNSKNIIWHIHGQNVSTSHLLK